SRAQPVAEAVPWDVDVELELWPLAPAVNRAGSLERLDHDGVVGRHVRAESLNLVLPCARTERAEHGRGDTAPLPLVHNRHRHLGRLALPGDLDVAGDPHETPVP